MTSTTGGIGRTSTKQLRVFESVALSPSLASAAKACCLSQPALTQSLSNLEASVGVRLVDRGWNGSRLTEAGVVFGQRVGRFFDRVEQAIAVSRRTGSRSDLRSLANRIGPRHLAALTACEAYGNSVDSIDKLSVSLPAARRCLRELEYDLGVPLLLRTAVGRTLSTQGLSFAKLVRLAFHEIDLGVEEAIAIERAEPRSITIGAMPSGGYLLLSQMLDDVARTSPNVDLTIVSDAAAELIDSLRSGRIDMVVGLVPDPLPSDLAASALIETPYVVVARSIHPLAVSPFLTTEELAACDWVVGDAGSHRRRCFDELFAPAGARAQIATSSAMIVQTLVESTDRLALMTSFEFEYGGGRIVRLAHAPIEIAPSLGIITRSDWLPTQLHRELVDMLRRHVAAVPDYASLRMIG